TQHIVQGDQAFLVWEFRFRMRRWRPQVEQCIHGATLVRFDAQGRVALHRDYWDAAQELYEKLPVLGGLMRWLRRSASATSTTKVPHAYRPSP
ncbi:MAG: nuclear transport factor 2 family protein, partial [Ottowia sp.]|nr:nuclear transport factor 2 family protein [Ottowia sp.]